MLVATRAASHRRDRHIGLGVGHADLATFCLEERGVRGDAPGIGPRAGSGAMLQSMLQRIPPTGVICWSRPGREPFGERSVMCRECVAADRTRDVCTDRVV